MKKLPVAAVCGISLMVVTILLYFAFLSNILLQAIHVICLFAILLSEGITTGYACFIHGNPRKLAATVISAGMIPVSVILSFIYVVNFPLGYFTYMGLFLAATLVVNTIAFIVLRFNEHKEIEHASFQDAKAFNMKLRKLVQCIMAEPAAADLRDRLRALEEDLHFCDNSKIYEADQDLYQLLLTLQQNIADPDFSATETLASIEQTLRSRNVTAAIAN